MNRRFGRVERAAYWLCQPGHVEGCLAAVILAIVIYIFVRYKVG